MSNDEVALPPGAERFAKATLFRANGSGAEPASRSAVSFKDAADFCAEYVPLAYTIEPMIRSGSLYTLTAKTGAGKTAWLISAALAIVAGRKDILGIEPEAGRVAYCSFENPDDMRMRLMIAAFVFNIDLRDIGDRLVILDQRAKPEAIAGQLAIQSRGAPFRLVAIDTLAALFDGSDINDAVQGGEFMRRIRPITQLPGLPSVVVAAHPVKNAGEDSLVPYGSGAILNEVDGNLTLWRKPESGIISLHWQGKLRGIEFQPNCYRVETSGSPDVLDSKGRQVQLPYLRPSAAADDETRTSSEYDLDAALLRAMQVDPKATQRQLGVAVNRSPGIVNRKLQRMKGDRLFEHVLGVFTLTTKGEKALEKRG